MRSLLLLAALVLGGATLTMAQDEAYRGDAAVTYHWMRTNAAPGECGCFSLNGFGVSGSWNIHSTWSIVTEFGSEFRASTSTQDSLTVTSFLAGARYRIPQPWLKGAHRPQPFAQFLIGPAHAGGGEAGVADDLRVRLSSRRRHRCPPQVPLRSTRLSSRVVPHAICQHQK